MATAELTVTANLAGLRQQLEQIPGITADQAAKMTAELNKSYKSAERAAKRAADQTKKSMAEAAAATRQTAAATKDLEDQLGKVGSSAGKFSGVMDLLVPGLGEAARGVADVADGLEATSGAMSVTTAVAGPLIAVIGAVVAANAIYQTSLRNTAALEEIRVQSIERVTAAHRRAMDAELELEVMAGQTSQVQADRLRLEADYTAQKDELEKATLRQVQANEKEIKSNEAWGGSLGFVSFGLLESAQAMGLAGKSTTQLARENAELTRSYDAGLQAITAEYEQKDALIMARDEAKKAAEAEADAERARSSATSHGTAVDRAAAEAARAKAAAYQESLELMDAEARAADETRGIIERLEESTASRARAALEGAEAVTAAAEHELARTLQVYQEGTAAAGARNDLQLALTAAYLSEVESIEAEAYAKRDELRKADSEKEQQANEKAAELRKQLATQGVELAMGALEENANQQAEILATLEQQLQSNEESMTVAQQAEAKKRIELQRVSAKKAFEITKVAKLAEATVNTAAAVAQALGSVPPPLNIAAAIAAGAAGAVQVAAIASQQPAFHSGGLVGGAPDEVAARLVRGEAVLSRAGRSVVGDDTINAANAGIAPPVRVVAINQYRHQIFRPFIRDHLHQGGPLSDALRGTRTVGMREAL